MRKDIYELTYRSEESHWWYVGRRRVILSWLSGSLPKTERAEKSLRLLDYGCGTGINLVHLASIGTAYGVDAAPDAIAFCRQRGLDNVVHAPSLAEITTANVFGGDFDVVTMFDVLEHLPDDVATLRRVRRLLKPSGLLIMTVPAFDWLWSGEDVVSEHLRRYTRASLSHALGEAGYDTLRMSYFNTLLFPLQAGFVLYRRAFSTWTNSMSETMVKPLPRPVNSALAAIVSVESMLLPKFAFPIGASLICTAAATDRSARQGMA